MSLAKTTFDNIFLAGIFAITTGCYNSDGEVSDEDTDGSTDTVTDDTDLGENPWSEGDPLPIALHAPAVANLNDQFFVAGGSAPGGSSVRLDVYDLVEEAWFTKPSMMEERRGHSAHVIEDILYIVAGEREWKEVDTLFAYDIEDEMWSERATLNSTRSFHASCVHENKIYAFGGFVSNGLDDDYTHEEETETVEMYDPELDTWTMLAPMSQASWELECVTLDGLIYVIYGDGSLDVYNPTQDSWSGSTNIFAGRGYGFGAVVRGSEIYLVGGTQSIYGSANHNMEVFDPVLSTTTQLTEMPEDRFDLSASTYDNKIYVFGGRNQEMNTSISVFIYDPALDPMQ